MAWLGKRAVATILLYVSDYGMETEEPDSPL